HQRHASGEVMSVDERPERMALIRRAHPVDLIRVDEMLQQTEEGEQETEDGHDAHNEAQARGAVNEDKRGGEVDEERRELDEHKARRVWIERERVDGRWLQPVCAGLTKRQQLNEADNEDTDQRQLQAVATQPQRARAPSVRGPE